ncbi:MAG: hypothetical protein NC299_03870 [Lachnospiraceae bacterium]|nr:hypothetical protein [Ruminococcus sp.]MCM1274484.1 hypothetical protein [Lachnospiraceae bacterium]
MKKPHVIILLALGGTLAVFAAGYADLFVAYYYYALFYFVLFTAEGLGGALLANRLRKPSAKRGVGTVAFMVAVYGVPLAVWGIFAVLTALDLIWDLDFVLLALVCVVAAGAFAAFGIIVTAVSLMIERKRAGLPALNQPIALGALLVGSAALWSAELYFASEADYILHSLLLPTAAAIVTAFGLELLRRLYRAKLAVKDVPYFICAYLPLLFWTVYGAIVEYNEFTKSYIIMNLTTLLCAAVFRAASAIFDRRKENT